MRVPMSAATKRLVMIGQSDDHPQKIIVEDQVGDDSGEQADDQSVAESD